MTARRPALVLLHGFAGHGESFTHLRRHLATSPEVLTPTLPGHDPRETLPAGGGFAAAANQLAARIAPKAPCHLAGYSMGGRLALALALDHPQLVERLTLIGTHPGLGDDSARRQRLTLEAGWISQLETEGERSFFERWQQMPLFASQRRLAPERLAEQARIRARHRTPDLVGIIRVLGLGAMPDYTPRLDELVIPVDLLVGQEDGKFRDLAETMLPGLANGRLQLFADAGHNLVLECPAELARFLEEPNR